MKKLIFSVLVLTIVVSGGVSAQPSLNFKRIVNNWPTIELYFMVSVDGQPVYNFNKEHNFRIHENGAPVGDFTLWCPDGDRRFVVSATFVMCQTRFNEGAIKNSANTYIDLQDGIYDESSIIWGMGDVRTALGMTVDLAQCKQAINAAPTTGAIHLYDAIYQAVQEVINKGNNPIRAVLVFAGGNDEGSIVSAQEIISLALRNRIPIYLFSFNPVDASAISLIAALTGGRHFHNPSEYDVTGVMYELQQPYIGPVHMECLITYQSECADSTLRTVDLTVMNVDDGSDTKTKTFKAPIGSRTNDSIRFAFENSAADDQGIVRAPLTIASPVRNRLAALKPFTLKVSFDEAVFTFDSISVAGTALEHAGYDVSVTGNQITLTTLVPVPFAPDQPLCYFALHPKWLLDKPMYSTLELKSVQFSQGCLVPMLENGTILVPGTLIPSVIPDGSASFCEGESMTLHCSGGFTDYLWSTGETAQSITVYAGGAYFVEAKNASGARWRSDTIIVAQLPAPHPEITPSGNVITCGNDGVKLSSVTSYPEYEWSNAATARTTTAFAAGAYYLKVLGENGCWGYSDTVLVTRHEKPVSVISGPSSLCALDSVYTYSVTPEAGKSYQWSVERGTILGNADGSEITVKWSSLNTPIVHLLTTDDATGCIGGAKLAIASSAPTPVIVQSKPQALKLIEGDSLTLDITGQYDAYLWNTGATASSIVVTAPGTYSCTVYDGPCTGTVSANVVTIPEPALHLSGSTSVCSGIVVYYSVEDIDGITYEWNVAGGTVFPLPDASGISVRWDQAVTGKVAVRCSLGNWTRELSIDVDVAVTPIVSMTVEGGTVACEGDTILLTAQESYLYYRWSTGETARQIRAIATGEYWVFGSNDGVCWGGSAPVSVTILDAPAQPAITFDGVWLRAHTSAVRYQWYLDGDSIPGANSDWLRKELDGVYTVRAFNANGCSTLSEPLTVTAIRELPAAERISIDVSPNPNHGAFTVSAAFEKPETFVLRIVNEAGKVVYSETYRSETASWSGVYRLENLPRGTYFMTVTGKGMHAIEKFTVR